jgi:Zn-dependent peptidase ImmA (M78 family)
MAKRSARYRPGLACGRTRQQASSEGTVVSAAFGNWEMQAGDPAQFAFRLALLPNPDGDRDRASEEERKSWGAFSVWVNGENLCAHIEQGEVLDSAHWYLLPLLEWLVDNWDPLLHEEQLPLSNAGVSAAESLRQTQQPPLSLKEVDDFEWMDTWATWWSRHCFRSAREGGLFPDLYLRRDRDKLEFSTGADQLPGIPDSYVFLTPNRVYHADPVDAAGTLFQVLSAAIQELCRRMPGSERLTNLDAKRVNLTLPERGTARMAWLVGLGGQIEKFRRVAAEISATLRDTSQTVGQQLTGPRRETPLVVDGSPYARLLYGAFSPTTDIKDVALLTNLLIKNYVPDGSEWLARLSLPLSVGEIHQLSPGEQGSRLGEQACELLGEGDGTWIDINSVVDRLEIDTSGINLSDEQVRAISVFGPTQRPHIYWNRRLRRSGTRAVRRFTLAHELCHLLLDREYGDELAIATGPWAPVAIEQRANAFAAAFLMPTWLLKDALAASPTPADDPETIRMVSSSLRVSASSLTDRLYNLGEITFDDRIRLRSFWLPGKTS